MSVARKLFILIFGMGIYDYFQKTTHAEATWRLGVQQTSVAGANYALGFENLSLFTDVFEQNIGMKPKAYNKIK